MDRFTFVIGKKRGRVDDVGGDPHTPNSSNGNANVVEDIVMPNMEDNEDKEDDEEEEEEQGVTSVARPAEGSSSAEDSDNDNLPDDNESGGGGEEVPLAHSHTAIAAVIGGKKPGGPVDLSQDPTVTSAACERSFSCLRRLKTYLRNRSGDARTSNLGLLAISSRRTKELDVNAVIDRFAANHNNRRIVLL
ncbi:Zinc finger MYM-type protein 1 [Dissostichus eleginoides]|uniref:Zinc finger MYM-type protein 1 n=1 Tax=Dissostichus eleginoides TaxID=100907 RepID=A0AAD9F2U8_DISEL|nr:Zinc finger MYM-type protein 1 [Dissostichus eleginoides]